MTFRWDRTTWRPDAELRLERASRAAALRSQGMTWMEVGWELNVGYERARQIHQMRWPLQREADAQRMAVPPPNRAEVYALARHPHTAAILAALA